VASVFSLNPQPWPQTVFAPTKPRIGLPSRPRVENASNLLHPSVDSEFPVQLCRHCLLPEADMSQGFSWTTAIASPPADPVPSNSCPDQVGRGKKKNLFPFRMRSRYCRQLRGNQDQRTWPISGWQSHRQFAASRCPARLGVAVGPEFDLTRFLPEPRHAPAPRIAFTGIAPSRAQYRGSQRLVQIVARP